MTQLKTAFPDMSNLKYLDMDMEEKTEKKTETNLYDLIGLGCYSWNTSFRCNIDHAAKPGRSEKTFPRAYQTMSPSGCNFCPHSMGVWYGKDSQHR